MKKFSGLASAVVALGLVNAASAADMPVKAPMMVAPVYNWTGFYAGVVGGYGASRTSQTNLTTAGTTGGFSGSGGTVGGTLGYNWQTANWVLGLEGDYSWAHIEANTFNNCPVGCNNRLETFGTARGRVGYAMGSWLLYGTGGLAYGHIHSWSGASGSDDKAGWTAGGGVEWMFLPKWSAKLEYLYADLGTSFAYAVPATVQNDFFRVNMVRAGINYHF